MKIRKFSTALALGGVVALSSCSDRNEDARVTESRLNDIDNIESTINDDMINTDTVENQDAEENVKPAGEATPPVSSTGGEQQNSGAGEESGA